MFIANPHTYVLEDGGRKSIDMQQLQLKQQVDPYGLLNPGKMRAWQEAETGVLGDPTPATHAKGDHLLASLADSWVDVIKEIYTFHQPQAGGK